MSRVYLSGPMSGIEGCNRPAFEAAYAKLKAAGHEVVSPHEAPSMDSWEDYMRHDLRMLLDCEVIALLPGWMASRGAQLEYRVASDLGFDVMEL